MQDAPQKTDRRTYLGGPDVAAIVGVSRFAAPIDVYLRKGEGGAPEQEVSERMEWGTRLESAIADGYSERFGVRIQQRRVPVIHSQYPFLGGSPDRWIVGQPGLLEIKVASQRAQWGEPGSADVPPEVTVQTQWYLGLTGRLFCDVAVLFGSRQLERYTVQRDQELIDGLTQAAIDFWTQRVIPRVPPDVDGTEAYRRHLAEKYPRDLGTELVATPEQQLLLDELQAAKKVKKEAETHETLLENRLREAMADAARLIAPNAVVTLRNEAPRTPWKAVAEGLAERAGLDIEEEASHAKEGLEGPRVLRVSWKGIAA